MKQRKTIGLALGSGGIRGLAHIGVLKVLIENNIPIDYIAGTSIGAWVGALYAINRDLDMVRERALEYRWDKMQALMELTLKGGMVKGKKVEQLLSEWMSNVDFKDLQMPVSVVTSDLISGNEYVINDGPVAPAVRASIAIPVIFQPVAYRGRLLVDGALLHPLPVDVARNMGADHVIGVNVDVVDSLSFDESHKPSLRGTALRSFHMMRQKVYDTSTERADVTIDPVIPIPPVTAWRKYFAQKNVDDIVQLGEIAALEQLDDITALIADA
jgi:NTE family protein